MKIGKLIFFVLIAFVFASCAKEISTEQPAGSVNEHKFFDAGKVSDPRLIGLMENLREKEKAVPFVDKLMNNVGFPRWDKALKSNNSSSNLLSSAGDSTYVIPIVDSSNKYIVGALVIHVAAVTSFEIKLLKDYLEYEQNKEDFIKAMISLDFKTFGYQYYEIKDSSLFDGHKGIELKAMPGNTGNNPCDLYEVMSIDDNGEEYGTGEWVTAGNCPSILIYFIPGGTAGGSGSYTLPDLTGLITGIGVTPPYTPYPFSLTQMVDYLNEQLLLTTEEKEWLMEHEIRAREMFEYLYGNYSPQRATIDKEHLQYMISEPEYLGFVVNHRNIYPGTNNMWWENEDFLDNPNNFNLDIDAIGEDPPEELKAAEKILVVQHPVAAIKINRNALVAREETIYRYGSNGNNDKSDAFRHTYWLALNASAVGANLALLFGIAHETETPPQFQLEEEMDSHNNGVGINVYLEDVTLSSEQLAVAALEAVFNGQCWYLSPILPPMYNNFGQIINPNGDPCFSGCTGNTLGTHGITSQTQPKPTNQ